MGDRNLKGKRLGRPRIGEEKLSQEEIKKRFDKKFKDGGGKTYTLRIKERHLVEEIQRLTTTRGAKSESALVVQLLEEAVRKLGQG